MVEHPGESPSSIANRAQGLAAWIAEQIALSSWSPPIVRLPIWAPDQSVSARACWTDRLVSRLSEFLYCLPSMAPGIPGLWGEPTTLVWFAPWKRRGKREANIMGAIWPEAVNDLSPDEILSQALGLSSGVQHQISYDGVSVSPQFGQLGVNRLISMPLRTQKVPFIPAVSKGAPSCLRKAEPYSGNQGLDLAAAGSSELGIPLSMPVGFVPRSLMAEAAPSLSFPMREGLPLQLGQFPSEGYSTRNVVQGKPLLRATPHRITKIPFLRQIPLVVSPSAMFGKERTKEVVALDEAEIAGSMPASESYPGVGAVEFRWYMKSLLPLSLPRDLPETIVRQWQRTFILSSTRSLEGGGLSAGSMSTLSPLSESGGTATNALESKMEQYMPNSPLHDKLAALKLQFPVFKMAGTGEQASTGGWPSSSMRVLGATPFALNSSILFRTGLSKDEQSLRQAQGEHDEPSHYRLFSEATLMSGPPIVNRENKRVNSRLFSEQSIPSGSSIPQGEVETPKMEEVPWQRADLSLASISLCPIHPSLHGKPASVSEPLWSIIAQPKSGSPLFEPAMPLFFTSRIPMRGSDESITRGLDRFMPSVTAEEMPIFEQRTRIFPSECLVPLRLPFHQSTQGTSIIGDYTIEDSPLLARGQKSTSLPWSQRVEFGEPLSMYHIVSFPVSEGNMVVQTGAQHKVARRAEYPLSSLGGAGHHGEERSVEVAAAPADRPSGVAGGTQSEIKQSLGGASVDTEALARDVYAILKWRLALERERRTFS